MKIFAPQSSRELGESIASHLGTRLTAMEERDFEDGEHKARPLESVRNQDVFVVFSLYGDEKDSVNDKLCRLLFFAGALKDASAKSVTAIVPYLCYARKDRKTKARDPVATRYVAQLFEVSGIDRVVTIDIHSIQAFQNSFRCKTEHLEAKNIFADYFAPLIKKNDVVLMSPNIKSIKRIKAFRNTIEKRLGREVQIAFIEKYRSEGNVSGGTVVGNVKNKTVIVLDDLISTGGTLARAAAACKNEGAEKVMLAATHGIFTGNASENLMEESVQQIVVCNTIPPFRLSPEIVGQKVAILDVAPLFAQAIQRIHEGGSIVELMMG